VPRGSATGTIAYSTRIGSKRGMPMLTLFREIPDPNDWRRSSGVLAACWVRTVMSTAHVTRSSLGAHFPEGT
jgi:hypothetical protein